MATNVVMPKLGMTMEQGKIVEWKKKEGEMVKEGEIVMVIETEKVTYEVESAGTGMLHIIVEEGTEVPVGEVVGVLAADQAEFDSLKGGGKPAAAAPAAQAPAPAAAQPAAPSAQPLRAPDEKVRIAPAARKLAEEKGLDISLITGTGPEGRITKEDVLNFEKEQQAAGEGEKVRISPVARKMAAEKGFDIKLIPGTGPGGRITSDDVLAYEKQLAAAKPQEEKKEAAAKAPSAPAAAEDRVIIVKRTGLRKVVAQKMLQTKHEAAQTYHSNDVDATAVEEFRAQLLPYAEKSAGVRVTITDILMKITGAALKEHPYLNSRYFDDRDELYKDVHMGMAMAVKEGELIVPVIRDINKKSIVEIAKDRIGFIDRGKKGKLLPDDIKGSTFTFSALGMFGLERFIAIINQPENGILAVGAILDKPWVYNGQLAIRKIVNTTLSYDHRTIYGAEAARFMATLKLFIENPLLVLA